MQNPRLLLLTRKFAPSFGGVQNYYKNLLLNLTKTKLAVLTATEEDSEDIDQMFEKAGVRIFRSEFIPENMGLSPRFKWFHWLIKFIKKVTNINKEQQIDYLLVGQARMFMLMTAFFIKLFKKKPYLLYLHGEEIPQIPLKSDFLSKYFYKKASGYLCNSHFTEQRLKKYLQSDSLKTSVITPGVEDKFFQRQAHDDIRSELGINGKFVIYTIARLDERKGQDMMIKALSIIKKRFPDVIYLIGGIGPRMEYLKNLVLQENVSENVIFLGLIPEDKIVAYHHLGDIFVQPNRTLDDGDTEGFGIVFLEANAAGKPVIAGNAGGALDAVVDGVTGFLVNPLDPNEIAEKICELLSNKIKANRLGKQGQQRAKNEFRWPVLSKKFEDEITHFSKN